MEDEKARRSRRRCMSAPIACVEVGVYTLIKSSAGRRHARGRVKRFEFRINSYLILYNYADVLINLLVSTTLQCSISRVGWYLEIPKGFLSYQAQSLS